VNLYGKTEGDENSYICMCKLCGSLIKNNNLRSSTVQVHFDSKGGTDYAHLLVTKLVRGSSQHTQQTQLQVLKPQQVSTLVEWLSDTLTPPNALNKPSWTEHQRTLDPSFKNAGYDAIYKELQRQVGLKKQLVLDAIAAERKASGGKFPHFHYEMDMWDEGSWGIQRNSNSNSKFKIQNFHCSLLIDHCLLIIAHCSLLIAHCSLIIPHSLGKRLECREKNDGYRSSPSQLQQLIPVPAAQLFNVYLYTMFNLREHSSNVC
jgi:hypothetical protein